MPKVDILELLEQIEKDKGIKKEEIIVLLEDALIKAYKKFYPQANIQANINSKTGEITAHIIKKVVEVVNSPDEEISIEEAKKINPQSSLNSEILILIDPNEFARVAARTAKQILDSKILSRQSEILFHNYSQFIGEIVNGTVHRFLNRNIIVDLGKIEGFLPYDQQIPNERWRIGQSIRSLVLSVEKSQYEAKMPAVTLSRSDNNFLKKLLELEIPEIKQGIVKVLNCVRIPGLRAKVAVTSTKPYIQAVGSCIGIKASRIHTIVNELHGERIDLILYDENIAKFIYNSFQPGKILQVKIISEENKKAEVLVDEENYPVVLGREGENVRLVSALTGWDITVVKK